MPARNIEWLIRNYFSNPEQRIFLESGDQLLRPGQLNRRLFLVRSGLLRGYMESPGGEPFELFRSGPNKLVGAYSFFSTRHQSYSTVEALEPTEVNFIEDRDLSEEGYAEFALHMLPAVVEEIYQRQLDALKLQRDRNEAMERLHQAEKMAALGQMAAGLAHELNNAIGVIQRCGHWLAGRLKEYLAEKDRHQMLPFFEQGLEKGQALSSREIRDRRRRLEERLGISPRTARALAKIGLNETELAPYRGSLEQFATRINYYFEMGLNLHDLLLAAEQAGQTVQSVRELGAAGRIQLERIQLNDTLTRAVELLQRELSAVQVELDLGELPPLTANANDWVQVWVNLLKNAQEAMENAETPRPAIWLKSHCTGAQIVFSVTDNGPGIPVSLQKKVFQPNVTTKKKGLDFGLGLGLSIVSRIVETYQGTIELDSRAGKTTFTIRLPIQ